jgi:hypothetical protein
MPPRRSARVAAVAERASSALAPLPLPLVLHIFSLLPVDARARAACVCRGWCHVLLELSLWTRLNVSPSSGVRVRVTDAVLRGAAAKARGQLAALDVSDCVALRFDALLAVAHANAGALRELRAGMRGMPQSLDVEQLLPAVPQLAALRAELSAATVADARRMLRNEAPFQPLRVHSLYVAFGLFADRDTDEASALALATDIAAHASLKGVDLREAPLHMHDVLDAVVDAALARQMTRLGLYFCRLSPASAPALVRLLGGGTLTELSIHEYEQRLFDGPSAALLGAALRANATLTSVSLRTDFWSDADAAAALLQGLTGHASLRVLRVFGNNAPEDAPAAGAALGALVAANAPALTELDVSSSRLGDAGLRPLFEALPANTHLRTLLFVSNGMTEAGARDVLLPAVRTNTCLRKLFVVDGQPGDTQDNVFTREAQALVAARGAAAAQAE